MYEPIFKPQTHRGLLSMDGVRYDTLYFKGFKDPKDPRLDPLHIHDYVELFFHISGKCSFILNGELITLSAGDVVISQPNEVHMCIFENAGEYEHYCVWIDLGTQSEHSDFTQFFSSNSFLSFSQKSSEQICERLETLCNSKSTLEATASLLQLLLLLQKNNLSQNSEPILPTEFREVLEDINRNFSDIRSISNICASHFVSPATLNRWFRRYLHVTPHEYIEAKRLSYAAKLLSVGTNVSETSSAVGFSDCSYFIRAFKRKFGITPLQFRKNES